MSRTQAGRKRRQSEDFRALPRVVVEGFLPGEPAELPQAELDKLRKVLRLSTGDPLLIVPGDGTVVRCRLEGRRVVPMETLHPQTEPALKVTLAQALPKGDRIETIVRTCTEIGVARFWFFPAARSVVRWDPGKREHKLRRLAVIAREAVEQCFRTQVPTIEFLEGLSAVLDREPGAVVLSESEGLATGLREATAPKRGSSITLVVGPEGGWTQSELAKIGQRGVTLGPRVLRTDTAGPAAAAILLLGGE